MSKNVDYSFSPISHWAYLAHSRFSAIPRRHGAVLKVTHAHVGTIFPLPG